MLTITNTTVTRDEVSADCVHGFERFNVQNLEGCPLIRWLFG